jgi:hypothetical protein
LAQISKKKGKDRDFVSQNEWNEHINLWQKKVDASLEKIVNVQVNGKIGLQESLRDIYKKLNDVHIDIVSTDQLETTFIKWRKNKKWRLFIFGKKGTALIIILFLTIYRIAGSSNLPIGQWIASLIKIIIGS